MSEQTEWPKRMNRQMASDYLVNVHCIQVKPLTLAKYGSVGGGPPFYKDGRFPRYDRDDPDIWARDRLKPPGWRAMLPEDIGLE